eukprot:TRINITY_DN13994_c0_g1_i2.p1 TRINITY_DN13994_c0_g1~~TRINITY_DN13994_c0_g1_i2.p1  ORF type:complete len:193 (+),score=23.07 TRINITY_DN13994_c0_g1_i2:500-1078(+)
MLTDSIMITAGHCVDTRSSDSDVVAYPPERKCGSRQGIPACKVLSKFTGGVCGGHDIALVRLSRPMRGMREIGLNFYSPRPGDRQVMAGTGFNNHNTCRSLISYQSVVDCDRIGCSGSQWYCTRGTYQEVSGSCKGDSGGPSWTFRRGFTGITSGATADEGDPCTNGFSIFTNLNFYKTWIETNMRKDLASC